MPVIEFRKGTKLQAIENEPFGTPILSGQVVVANGEGGILKPAKFSMYMLPSKSGGLKGTGFRIVKR